MAHSSCSVCAHVTMLAADRADHGRGWKQHAVLIRVTAVDGKARLIGHPVETGLSSTGQTCFPDAFDRFVVCRRAAGFF